MQQSALEFGKSVLDIRLFELGGTPVSLATVIILSVVALLSWRLSRLIERGVAAGLRQRKMQDEGSIRAIARLSYYVVIGIGLTIALQTAGFNLSAVFAASAVFAVGLGFAMQNLMENFVSGLFMLLEQSITPGDVLEVEGRVVRVISMRMRNTIARTRDEEDLIIPNATLSQSTVKNYTLKDSMNRMRVVVGVSYDSDMVLVRKVLEMVARTMPFRANDHEPQIVMAAFGASSVDWEVSIWSNDPWSSRRNAAVLNEAIWFAFKEAGVVIAYPQLDLHLDNRALDAIAGKRKPSPPPEA